MRIVIQRVLESSVRIDGEVVGAIGRGLMILCGFCAEDTEEDLLWTSRKAVALRIFDDENGVMNLSVKETGGGILCTSQFTLMAATKKGNRPSYIAAAPPDISVPLYERFKTLLSAELGQEIACGRFGADMKVSLINDGPVTIYIDSKNKF